MIEREPMLKKFFFKALNNIEKSEKVEILKNGIFLFNDKIILYCIKDEKIEDEYISDIDNIECIEHDKYDNSIDENKEKEIKSISDKSDKSEKINFISNIDISNDNIKLDNDNKSCKSSSIIMPKNNKISGLKNRALGLESLVFFYFKQLNLLPLPDIIFNPTFDNKNLNSLKLYYEWDGCFLSKRECDLKQLFISPFNKEKTFKIESDQLTEDNKGKFLIRKNSFIFIEVKTHFPKKKEKEKAQNLENIIKVIFQKLNHYIPLFSNILKSHDNNINNIDNNNNIKNIHIILLYNQNRIIKFNNNIFRLISKYKTCLRDIEKYIIYFDILYIFPSIGKLSLNYINKKLSNILESLEEVKQKAQNDANNANIKIKSLEEANQKVQNDANNANIKIKSLEEANQKAQNDANKKIKYLEEVNQKAQNDTNKKIKSLEEANQKAQNDTNKKIKSLEEANQKAQNDANIKIKSLEEANQKAQNDANIKIKSLEEANQKTQMKMQLLESKYIKIQNKLNESANIVKKFTELEKLLNKVIQKSNIKNEEISNIESKSGSFKKEVEIFEKKNIERENDNIFNKIKEKINNKSEVLDYEKIYFSLYINCKKEFDSNDFDLTNYKKNHCSNEKFANIFHNTLKKYEKLEVENFFSKYNFIPCMSECSKLYYS